MTFAYSSLILASQSPRRRQLLAEAGYDFVVIPPSDSAESGVDAPPGESPFDFVKRLARQKAEDVAMGVGGGGIVVGCDTIVVSGDEILGKPRDKSEAGRMLRLLRGARPLVLSGLCLWAAGSSRHMVDADTTELAVTPLTDDEINTYLTRGHWAGKAGAFGYQDGHDWLHIISGSQSNVVGLPLELLARMLRTF